MNIRLVTVFLVLLLASCNAQATATPTPHQPASTPTDIIQPDLLPTPETSSIVPQITSCEDWQSWRVIPTISQSARELYQRGQVRGNDPGAFSKVGDGEISTAWFLSTFELGPEHYDLGPHQSLLPVIDHFAGSFERIGMAAKRGFNTRRILDTAAELPTLCEAGESPLTCELRLHRPAFAILSLGTNQVWQPDEFEAGMRRILEILLARDVVPILSTKGDNLEGNHRINHTIACLAVEYDLPLWNFWSAIQPLPDHGLEPDLEHLTYGSADFDDEHSMRSAWTVRNLTALQVLDAVWHGVSTQP